MNITDGCLSRRRQGIPFTVSIIISLHISFINPHFHKLFCLNTGAHTEGQSLILGDGRHLEAPGEHQETGPSLEGG